MKIDLDYNIETMRITDPGEDAGPGTLKPQVGSIMSQIKAKTNVETRDSASTESDTSSKDLGEAQSTKLKQMLASLKTSKTL
jgi:hypothetical protein